MGMFSLVQVIGELGGGSGQGSAMAVDTKTVAGDISMGWQRPDMKVRPLTTTISVLSLIKATS
jgi:hypothetical protein